jgi:hypothetical protein
MVAVNVTVWLTAEVEGEETTMVEVEVLPTDCTSGVEALRPKFVSPLYFATMLSLAVVRNV